MSGAQLRIRLAAVALFVATALYLPWLYLSLNDAALWLAVPFVAANTMVAASACLTAYNNWERSSPDRVPVPTGEEPAVAVVIPTCGEPIAMVQKTVESVLAQDWPAERLIVVVSDDAHSTEMRQMVARISSRARLEYHEPPLRLDPARKGEAKAGNLNSALEYLDRVAPSVEFVETRDADDEVGDRAFLREAVGQLLADEGAAYVQTIKEAQVSEADPFGNNDPLFYRGSMLARHAANAVFPCGSGLVWRRAALDDIDGFPGWNLVEDLQSGVEALRRGWRGIYLPIVGAVGQTAPEDIPNVYKQRGTWALDTVRLVLWGEQTGLSVRQRLHFAELALFYAQSLALVVFVICPAIGLVFDVYPLSTTQLQYALRFWPFVVAIELLLAALNSGSRYEQLWRTRQLWAGLAPVYLKACLLAVRGGPHRKPAYRVTRKDVRMGWYWRETLPQALAVALLGTSVLVGLARHDLLTRLDLGSAYWAALQALLLSGFLPRSWHGFDWRASLRERAGTRAAAVPAGAPPRRLRLVPPLAGGQEPSGRRPPRTVVLPDGREIMNRRRPGSTAPPPRGGERRVLSLDEPSEQITTRVS